jgi:O-acetylhomoserine/O-acetylserine sulfhydrylase-like pyridoxal-dependent enzyme
VQNICDQIEVIARDKGQIVPFNITKEISVARDILHNFHMLGIVQVRLVIIGVFFVQFETKVSKALTRAGIYPSRTFARMSFQVESGNDIVNDVHKPLWRPFPDRTKASGRPRYR